MKPGILFRWGAIAVRDNLAVSTAEEVNTVIQASIEYAYANQAASRNYIREHAQEMDPEVIRQHIALYVNAYSVNLGPAGRQAILKLFTMARANGILPEFEESVFARP